MINALAIFASLTDTPYLLRIHEIAELTDFQIWRIYGKERDSKGVPKQMSSSLAKSKRESELVDAKAQFLSMGAAMGLNLAELQSKWANRNVK